MSNEKRKGPFIQVRMVDEFRKPIKDGDGVEQVDEWEFDDLTGGFEAFIEACDLLNDAFGTTEPDGDEDNEEDNEEDGDGNETE